MSARRPRGAVGPGIEEYGYHLRPAIRCRSVQRGCAPPISRLDLRAGGDQGSHRCCASRSPPPCAAGVSSRLSRASIFAPAAIRAFTVAALPRPRRLVQRGFRPACLARRSSRRRQSGQSPLPPCPLPPRSAAGSSPVYFARRSSRLLRSGQSPLLRFPTPPLCAAGVESRLFRASIFAPGRDQCVHRCRLAPYRRVVERGSRLACFARRSSHRQRSGRSPLPPCPPTAALCSGVWSPLSRASIFAPLAIKAFTVSVLPPDAALCSGVSPCLFRTSIFAPAAIRASTANRVSRPRRIVQRGPTPLVSRVDLRTRGEAAPGILRGRSFPERHGQPAGTNRSDTGTLRGTGRHSQGRDDDHRSGQHDANKAECLSDQPQ